METKYLEDYLQQCSQWQTKLLRTWLNGFERGENFWLSSANSQQVINSQEKTFKTLLEIQARTAQLMIESQRQLWHDYFDNMRMAWAVENKEEVDIPLKLSTTSIQEAFSADYEPQPDDN